MKKINFALSFLILLGLLGCWMFLADPSVALADNRANSLLQPNVSQENEVPEMHEVYSLITDTIMFDGLRPPYYESRADIAKGLPKEKDDEVYIGFPISRMSSQSFVDLVDSVKERCDQYGYKFEFTDAAGSLEKQRADFEAFVTKGVDAIIINPIEPAANEMDVVRAVEQGVIVMGCGISFYPSAGVLTSLWTNNYEIGFDVGVETAKHFGKNEEIVLGMILGRFGQSMCESMGNGFVAGMMYARYEQMGKPYANKEDAMLAGYKIFSEFRDKGKIEIPDAKLDIVAAGEGQLTADAAMKITDDILTAHPEMNLLYCENSNMAEGVVRALDSRNIVYGNKEKLKLVIANGSDEFSMNLLREDKLLCITETNPKTNGYAMVDIIHAVLEEGFDADNLTISTYAPVVVLTKDNLDEYHVPGEFYPIPLEVVPISINEWNAGKTN